MHPPKKLSTRTEQVFMSGRLKELQHQKQIGSLTPYQDFLYKRAVVGLRVYTPEEIQAMNRGKKTKIHLRHKTANRAMHEAIEAIISVQTRSILKIFSEKSNLAKNLLNVKSEERIVFKIKGAKLTNYRKILLHLGMRDNQIVDILIASGALPKEFYEIEKPRHENRGLNK